MAAVIGLVGCAGFAAMIGWIPHLLLQLVVGMQTLGMAVWFGGEDADPMLLEEEKDTSPPDSGSLAAELIFGCCLLYLYSVAPYHCVGLNEMFFYTGSSFIKYK